MAKSVAALTTLAVALLFQVSGLTQAPPAGELTFDVVSVKPNKSGALGGGFNTRPGGQLVITNNTLRNMVRNAYQLQNFQIVGGPDWFDTERFDVTAKAPMSDPTMPQFRTMVEALLADRFKLVVHRETRELPIYALVLARPDGRLGSRLTRSTADCAALAAAGRRGAPPPPPDPSGRPLCGTRTNPGRIQAGGVLMTDLARNLANFAGRMTVDKTGLTGAFDLDLEYTPDQLPANLPPGLPPPPADGPSLFAALQEQLGLKLESQRGPVDVVVIDSATRPVPD